MNISRERSMTRLLMKHRISLKSKLLKYVYSVVLSAAIPKILQKLISGRYLGEIMRLILCELIDEGVLFLGQSTYKLEIPYAFDTAFLSLMERYNFSPWISPHLNVLGLSDPTDEQLMTIGIFSHFFGIETTLVERQFFRSLAHVISTRAARLSACGIAALVRQIGCLEEGCSVGADGTLYNVSPSIIDLIWRPLKGCSRNTPDSRIACTKVSLTSLERREGITTSLSLCNNILSSTVRNILTHHAEDGSGVGSAIIACEWRQYEAHNHFLIPVVAMTKKRRDAGLYLEC